MNQLRWPRHRRASEGGAVIVEAVIVLPVLLALVFGAIEYGLLYKEDLTGSNVVRRAECAPTSSWPRSIRSTPADGW